MKNLKYSIAEAKKADLDSLIDEVQQAEYKVSELQTVVTSLEQKSTEFAGFLNEAEASKDTALSNLNLLEATLNNVNDFAKDAKIGSRQSSVANDKVNETSREVSELIGQLIYAGEIVNKFAELVFKKKLLNPLISDELVKTVTTANADVNEAVASTLTALQSCFASNVTAGESNSLCGLQQKQADELLELMRTGLNQYEIFNIPQMESLLDNVLAAENLVKASLVGDKESAARIENKIANLRKELANLIEADIELYGEFIEKEVLLNFAEKNHSSEKEIKELEAAYKKADSAFKANHRKCEAAQRKLDTIYEEARHGFSNVQDAQNHYLDLKKELRDVSVILKEVQHSESLLKDEIATVKNPEERLELDIRLLVLRIKYQLQKGSEESLLMEVNNAQMHLKDVNRKFANADSRLAEANAKLINATSQAVGSKSILVLLTEGYSMALEHYRQALKASRLATKELDQAQASLDTATHNLSSLQAGLSAANSAALAA